MTTNDSVAASHTGLGDDATPGGEPETSPPADPAHKTRRFTLGVDKFSAVYVWGILMIVFAFWLGDKFMNTQNFRIIAQSQAIIAIVALGLLVPVACGVFDLSIAGTVGVAETTVMYMQANDHGTFVGILCGLAAGLVVGLINAFVVLKLHVDSFIATLGMSSILVGAILA